MNERPVVEQSLAERRRKIKKIKRKRRIRLAIVIAAFILLLCAVAAPVTALIVFRVDDFKINGKTRYTNEQIIAATGITDGASLLFLKPEKVKASIESKLPYVDSVKVEKQLPGTVIITLTATGKVYVFGTDKGGYVLTNSSFKVLEAVSKPPQSAIIVKCKASVKANKGEVISFVSKGEDNILTMLKSINDSLTEAGLDGITLINLLDENNIRLVYDSRLLLRLGENDKIDSKLALAKKVVDDQNAVNPTRFGMINLKVAKKAYFLPCKEEDVKADAYSAKEIIPTAEKGTEITDEDTTAATNKNGEAVTTAKREETTTQAQSRAAAAQATTAEAA